MGWTGLDQRQFPRLSTECEILIKDHGRGVIKVRTENIGMGGVCVILKEELSKLSHVQFHLTLSENESPIDCEGRVVWIVRSKNPGSQKITFDTGIEFLNLKPEQKSSLERFLAQAS